MAVVTHVEVGRVVEHGQHDIDRRRPGVPLDVRQRLLGDAQERDLDRRRQETRISVEPEGRHEPMFAAPGLDHPGERPGQVGVPELGRPEGPDQPPDLAEAFAGDPAGVGDRTTLGRTGGHNGVGGFEVHDNAGEALGQRVVQVPRQPGPLGQRTRLALGIDPGRRSASSCRIRSRRCLLCRTMALIITPSIVETAAVARKIRMIPTDGQSVASSASAPCAQRNRDSPALTGAAARSGNSIQSWKKTTRLKNQNELWIATSAMTLPTAMAG